MKSQKIAIILGTRPEVIKMSPVVRELMRKKLDFFILHTNQHYSANLDKIFFKELELPRAKYNLKVGSGNHGETTSRMLVGIENILLKEKPGVVLVQGDTNTVLAGALAATKLHIKVGHIEAGLRSYSRKMPEETNRVLSDHCSDYLFAPTKKAKNILIKEGIDRKNIFVTGNTIVDAVYNNLELSNKNSDALKKLQLSSCGYLLLTIHREENVDNKNRLNSIFEGLKGVSSEFNLPIIYPIHPRSEKMIKSFNLKIPKGVRTIEPTNFLDFLNLEVNAKLVLTDSGGVQEETCILKTPCVTLRDNTERPETIDVNGNCLAGIKPHNIIKQTKNMINKKRNWENPFGDGEASKKIIKILEKNR